MKFVIVDMYGVTKFFKDYNDVKKYITSLIEKNVWDKDRFTLYDCKTGKKLGVDLSLKINHMGLT